MSQALQLLAERAKEQVDNLHREQADLRRQQSALDAEVAEIQARQRAPLLPVMTGQALHLRAQFMASLEAQLGAIEQTRSALVEKGRDAEKRLVEAVVNWQKFVKLIARAEDRRAQVLSRREQKDTDATASQAWFRQQREALAA